MCVCMRVCMYVCKCVFKHISNTFSSSATRKKSTYELYVVKRLPVLAFKQFLKGILQFVRGSQINVHMYTILVVPSNCGQRSLINNYL